MVFDSFATAFLQSDVHKLCKGHMQILVHSGICLVQIKSHISLVNKTIFYQISQFALPDLMHEPKRGIVLFDRKSPIRLKLNPKKFNGPKHNHQSQFNFLCQKKLNLCFHYFSD